MKKRDILKELVAEREIVFLENDRGNFKTSGRLVPGATEFLYELEGVPFEFTSCDVLNIILTEIGNSELDFEARIILK